MRRWIPGLRAVTARRAGSPAAAAAPAADPWRVTGCSVRGASHLRAGLESQDAIGWIPAAGTGCRVAVSVADGHGSPRNFRSATGARLAIEVSHELAGELLALPEGVPGLPLLKDRLEQSAPRRLVRAWRARVDEHLSQWPFTPAELAAARERDGDEGPGCLARNPYLAYGSTLVTAVAMESCMAFWQIGDGDVLLVAGDGQASRPLPRDELLAGNETTSLCTAEAWRLFRVAVLGTTAPVVLASTDGLANSFRDEQGFFRFGSDLLRMLADDGIDAVGGRLGGWLGQMTAEGSGDDISLGLLCRPAALPAARLPEGRDGPGPAAPDRERGEDATW